MFIGIGSLLLLLVDRSDLAVVGVNFSPERVDFPEVADHANTLRKPTVPQLVPLIVPPGLREQVIAVGLDGLLEPHELANEVLDKLRLSAVV